MRDLQTDFAKALEASSDVATALMKINQVVGEGADHKVYLEVLEHLAAASNANLKGQLIVAGIETELKKLTEQ